MTGQGTQPEGTGGTPTSAVTLLPRMVPLGGGSSIEVRRVLPGRPIRAIGPWCFLDHYGPTGTPMEVGPHPHCGIQTVSWLLHGAITHRDSLGHKAVVRAGELSLMTAGVGIAHSEHSRVPSPDLLGVQLWLALPDRSRDCQPAYEHLESLPADRSEGIVASVLMGALLGLESPAQTLWPTVAAALELPGGAETSLALDPSFEYGVLAVAGSAEVSGAQITPGRLRYLGWGNRSVAVASRNGSHLLLIGGEPMSEPILMWWNFVARSHDEIVQAREEWESGRRFGQVVDDQSRRMSAPPIPPIHLLPRAGWGR